MFTMITRLTKNEELSNLTKVVIPSHETHNKVQMTAPYITTNNDTHTNLKKNVGPTTLHNDKNFLRLPMGVPGNLIGKIDITDIGNRTLLTTDPPTISRL